MMKLADNVYSVGVINPNLRVFDVIMKTEYGTTYNSFLIKGKEKTVLIDTCHKRFFDRYLENIREICDPAEIDYIILNHNEPDHSGSLAEFLKLCPKAEVIASQAGALYLKNITNTPSLKVRVVKHEETLDIGGGEVLRFINAPFLHWPDSMFTWMESTGVLFSCDFLGCHYCEPYGLDYNVVYPEKYEDALRYYYDCIFGPFKPYVIAGLDKIKDLDIKICATSHGPCLTKGCMLEPAIQKYREWSTPVAKTQKHVPVFYCTAYGNTELVAQQIAEGIRETLENVHVPVYNVIEHDIDMLRAQVNDCDALCVGSPTINRDALPVMFELLAHIDAINCQKRPALVFGSYGWSGEAVPHLKERLASVKFNLFEDGFKVTFVPSEEDLKQARELGRRFGESLK